MSESITPSLPPPLPATPVQDSKPRVWPAFVAFATLLIMEIIAATVVVMVIALIKYGVKFNPDKILAVASSAPGLLGSFVCTMTIAAGIALAGAWLSPVFWRDRLRLRMVPLRLPIMIMGTLGIMSVGMMLSSCMELGWFPRSSALDILDHMMKKLSLSGTIVAGLLLGLLPGLVEEMLFRGYIQTRLVARWGAMWGIFWTALMFGISHMDLMQGAFAVVVGCLLGFITVRTGSIVPAMICHAGNNTLSMLLTVTAGDVHDPTPNLVILLAGLIILPLAILYLRLRLPSAKANSAA